MNPATALTTRSAPLNTSRIIFTGTQPDLEQMFADAARRFEEERKK